MANPSAAPTIAEQIAEMEPLLIAHFNASYSDALTILGRAHSGLEGVEDAELRAMACESFTLGVRTADGVTDVVVPFDRPLADLADIQTASVAAIAAARAQLGITQLTSAEVEAAAFAAIPTHITTVVATEMVTPRIKQITFGGGDLVNFQPLGPDQFIYVLAAAPGQAELPIDSSFSWEQYEATEADERPIGAYYTVRHWRPEAAELDMWFVLHGDGDDHTRRAGVDVGGSSGARRIRRVVGTADVVVTAGRHRVVSPDRRRDRAPRDRGDPRVAAIGHAGPSVRRDDRHRGPRRASGRSGGRRHMDRSRRRTRRHHDAARRRRPGHAVARRCRVRVGRRREPGDDGDPQVRPS